MVAIIRGMKRFALISALVLVSTLLAGCGGDEPPPWPPSDDAVAAMNRGLGLMEKFDYVPALEAFEEASRLCPKWTAAKVNTAIALLNDRTQADGDSVVIANEERAVAICREILKTEPDHLHANYLLGTILLRNGFPEESLPLLEKMSRLAPNDASVWFRLGKAFVDNDRQEDALAAFNRSIELDPHLAAAYHQQALRFGRLGRMEEAAESRARFRTLVPGQGGEPYQGNLLTDKAYHEIGTYAMVIRKFPELPKPEPKKPAVTFELVAPFAGYAYGGEEGPDLVPVERKDGESDADYVLRVASRIGPGVVLGDYDSDGDTDVYLPQWGGSGKLYRNDGGLAFADVTAEAGISVAVKGIAGTFFDADGDTDLDLYVTCAGPNVFYENDGKGKFIDRTAETGLGGGDVISLAALPGDFDHEGDIDLWVANYARLGDASLAGAPDLLFRNNRDGTFKEVAGDSAAAGGDGRTLGALAIDFDRDLDTDFLVIRDRGPALLLMNDRFMSFHEGELPEELTGNAPAWGATAADIDTDGREEILVFRGPGADCSLFEVEPPGKLVAYGDSYNRLRWRTGLFTDLDLNGVLDLVGDGSEVSPAWTLQETRGMGFADFDGDGDLDRLAALTEGPKLVRTDVANGHHWVAFKFTGRVYPQPASWASKVGPDQEVEVRSGRLWQALRARAGTGFLSTVEPVLRFGLGEHDLVEVLRIVWPDRVLQVEVEIPADAVHEITEINRKPTSCPLLFAWDGREWQFVTDFLGVGGLGFLAAPGVYGDSDPDEYVRIGEWVKPIDGEYVLQLMEPLEEITYLDDATLVVVDHPASMEVHPNERFIGVKSLFPEARIYGFEKTVLPRAATDIRGNDILATISKTDRDCAPIEPDRRFLGFAKEHAVTLDFTGRVPKLGDGERLILFIEGWLEYGYSHTFYAAWQAGAQCAPPALERPDGKGGWKTLDENIGAPAGITKGMTVDVTGLVTPEHPVFRIRSTMEVNWDRISLGVDRAPGRIRVTRLKPSKAHLHHRGYPREFSPDGRMPLSYHYAIMDPAFTLKNIPGNYTRFGDVTPLATGADDRFVVMGRGEEVTVRYPVAALPKLPDGHRRTLILHATGWCKDRDPYTGEGETVGPLPFRAMKRYPFVEGEQYPLDNREWIEEWNTRKVSGR
jgi:tetratricopeptide (TPR) repeat protein